MKRGGVGHDGPVLSATGLWKEFGNVTAVANVDLEIFGGEVLAIVGDNGAGKSTLISLLCGVRNPDSGSISIDGQPVRLDSPRQAQDRGIATVFQDLALVEDRNVAQNMFLGREPRRLRFFVDNRMMERQASETMARLKVGVASVRSSVRDLSGGQRQAVAVGRSILFGSRVFLMDEPTASLGVREASRVFELIHELRAAGIAIVLVTHNVESVMSLADRVLVMRLGRKIADLRLHETSREDLVELIVSGRVGTVA